MNKNVEIVSLIYRSTKYLKFIVNQLLSDRCKVDGWEIGVRIVANHATNNVLSELKKLDINHTIFEGNYHPKEYYLNKVYRAYNHCVITSEYDNVCLINSDDGLSENWIKNLLKHHDGINIPCSRLIESGKMNSGQWGVNLGNNHFGRTCDEFDVNAFDNWVNTNSTDEIKAGGLYMPCIFEKKRFIEAGMYPCGNIYNNGIGTHHFNGSFRMAGDDFFFHEILEKKYNMKHITVFDSPVYHIIEGEKDE
jgi:hypothetical protein